MTEESACAKMEEKVMMLVYDELPQSDVPDVQAHIADCDTCRSTYRELKDSADLLDESTASLPPLALSNQERTKILMSILEDEQGLGNDEPASPSPSSAWQRNPVVWAILLLVLAVAGFFAFRLLQG